MKGIYMISKNKLLKDESGQSLILIALLFAVLCGIAAFVIDIGRVDLKKSQLQNAADAAALAAAHDLPSRTAAAGTAVTYAEENGVEASEITVTSPYNGDSTKIEVVCKRTVNYTFARALGFTSKSVSARAVAQKASAGGEAFNYAVFAGGGPVLFNGVGNKITGNIFGRDGVRLGNKADVHGNVVCTSSGQISTGNKSSINGSTISDSAALTMPDFSELIKEQGIVCDSQSQFNAAVNGKTVDGPIYVNGNITINGRIKGTGIIYASGTITFLNNDILQTSMDHILFYAATGNITFNGGSATYIGILYAPNGTITFHGAKKTIYGRAIAQKIVFDGASQTISSDEHDLDSLSTLTLYKLVE